MAKEKAEPFKCAKCKKKQEEMWKFGIYGENEKRKEDENYYCKECFEKREKETV